MPAGCLRTQYQSQTNLVVHGDFCSPGHSGDSHVRALGNPAKTVQIQEAGARASRSHDQRDPEHDPGASVPRLRRPDLSSDRSAVCVTASMDGRSLTSLVDMPRLGLSARGWWLLCLFGAVIPPHQVSSRYAGTRCLKLARMRKHRETHPASASFKLALW